MQPRRALQRQPKIARRKMPGFTGTVCNEQSWAFIRLENCVNSARAIDGTTRLFVQKPRCESDEIFLVPTGIPPSVVTGPEMETWSYSVKAGPARNLKNLKHYAKDQRASMRPPMRRPWQSEVLEVSWPALHSVWQSLSTRASASLLFCIQK